MSQTRREWLFAAEQALGSGRFDQAVRLLSSEAVQDASSRRLAIDLHHRLAENCRQAIEEGRWSNALENLRWLFDLEGDSNSWSELHSHLSKAIDPWVGERMSGERFAEVEHVHQLASSLGLSYPVLERSISEISVIRSARKLAALGRYAEAEQCLFEKENSKESTFLLQEADRLRACHEKTKGLLGTLNQSAEAKDWNKVLKLSDELLVLASRHPSAIQWRQRAVAELAAQGIDPKKFMEPGKQMAIAMHAHPSTHAGKSAGRDVLASPAERAKILWVDGVGGYTLCDSLETVIGQAVPGNPVELMIVGDLSRRAAVVRRSGEDHLLQPLQTVLVNGAKMDRATLLRHGDLISIGPRVQLRYTRPNRLSATACLEMVSRNRWQPSVDGVLLMGDSCILGPGSTSHVLCPYWSTDVVLFRNKGEWMVKSASPLEVGGKEYRDAVPLTPGVRVRGPDFSLSLE